MHGLNLYRKRNLQWFSKLVDGNFMKTCKERIAFRWFTGMMPGTVPCHLWKLYRRRPISIMSKIYSADLRGLQSTLLLKESYPSFDECIQHDSLRIESPLLQRSLTIHKYIPLRFLLVLLREQMLIFRQVSSWEDPYENFFLKQHFVQPGHSDPYVSVENLTKGLYGMSWTSQEETDSLWRIYSPDKMSVRISSTVENLVETVCSEDDKWDVWVNAVQYKSYEEITEWLGQIKTIKERDQFMASLFFTDSSCAKVARKESINSVFSPKVYRLSVSKKTPTGGVKPLSILISEMQSTRLRAKRETLLVTIRSYSPLLQARIISLNSSLFFSDVPDMPSSAYMRFNSQLG